MNNKTYDILKRIGRYVLPAVATCVASIFKIWGIPYGAEISATIMAIDTLWNVCLGISSAKFYTNEEDVSTEEE